jgi:hypothetical protein
LEGDNSIPAGRYYVDVFLENEDGSATAVYHRTVVILNGLMTEVRFAPGPADFLSEETRAALTAVGSLVFDVTADEAETGAAGIVVDAEDVGNGNISVSAPTGTSVVYFTVGNPDGLTLSATNATKITDGVTFEGSTAGAYLAVFEVDTSAYASSLDGGKVIVHIAAEEDGREPVPLTVTVTVEAQVFGLFVDNDGELERVANPIADLNAAFGWLEQYAANDTSYVIRIDEDYGLTHYRSRVGSVGVTVTLRGAVEERIVTWDGNNMGSSYGGLIRVENGTTFVLGENITLDGVVNNLTRPMVYVVQSKFVMKPGSKLTRRSEGGSYVVYLEGNETNNAYFTMEGGLISDNYSMATVYCAAYAIIVMEDGEILNNQTYSDNAAVFFNGRNNSFTMRGGKISGNTRGVWLNRGNTFTMEDGEISNNGISTMTGPYKLDTAYNNTSTNYVINGGGVLLYCNTSADFTSFIMSGGKILNNGDNNVFGSGILQLGGYTGVVLNGEVEIRGNSINAHTRPTNVRNPITVGENFVNLSGDPITVDVIGLGGYVSSASVLLTNFTTAPAQPIVSDVTKLDSFTTGKAGIVNSSGNFTIYANSYTIDNTGVLVRIP